MNERKSINSKNELITTEYSIIVDNYKFYLLVLDEEMQ